MSKPLTVDDILAAAVKAAEQPWAPPMRLVSARVYQAAQDALAAGASAREVELILWGASPELAKKLANE